MEKLKKMILTSSEREIVVEEIVEYLVNNPEILFMNNKEKFKLIMELLMRAERRLHLDNSPNDKGNGYTKRKLNTSMGQIELNVPRDRDGDFRPSVLPPKYQRFDESYLDLISAGINNFYSQSGIKSYLNNLNLPYSQSQLNKLSEDIYEEFKKWNSRELPEDVIALFIDGFHTELYDEEENKVLNATVYLILGIDFKGIKDLYLLEFMTGSESKGGWLEVFNKLISRGVKRPLVIVSDDFPGIMDAVKTIYPNSYHQLCWTHFRRNIRKNMNKKDSKEMSKEMEKLKLKNNFESAKKAFIEITDKYKEKYPGYISHIQERADNILCFFNFEESIRKHFYTTNIVESFNSGLSVIETNAGGFFRSKKMLEMNCFIKRNKLKKKKWAKPAPNISANIYYLRQMFAVKFGELPKVA